MKISDLLSDAVQAEVDEAKNVIQRCISGEKVSAEEIKTTQQLFNKLGVAYLQQAIKCFNLLKGLD